MPGRWWAFFEAIAMSYKGSLWHAAHQPQAKASWPDAVWKRWPWFPKPEAPEVLLLFCKGLECCSLVRTVQIDENTAPKTDAFDDHRKDLSDVNTLCTDMST